MASGDPPVIGNPADKQGTISFTAQQAGDNDNMLRVNLVKKKFLEIVIDKRDGTLPVTVRVPSANWALRISEVD